MHLLLAELSNNHHEALLALLAYTAALPAQQVTVLAPPSTASLYTALAEVHHFIPFSGWEPLLRDQLHQSPFTHVFHVTAYGREPLKLAQHLEPLPQVGLIHNTQKLQRFSWLQWRLRRYLKHFFVLRPGLLGGISKTYPLSYLPIHFCPPSFYRLIPPSPLPHGSIYIAIPGRIEYKRRDYFSLIEALRHLKGRDRFRFLLLGPSEAPHSDYPDLATRLEQVGYADLFIRFAEVIDFPRYHAYIQQSRAVLPLVHLEPAKAKPYLRYQIMGAFPLAHLYKKPLLLPQAFADEPDLEDSSFFYDSPQALAQRLEALAAGDLPLSSLYQRFTWDLAPYVETLRQALQG